MIARRETPLALYKGLGAVLSGIVPKMAVRFASFETYKEALADKETGKTNLGSIFLGALDHSFWDISSRMLTSNSYRIQLVLELVQQKPSWSSRRWKSSRSVFRHSNTLWQTH